MVLKSELGFSDIHGYELSKIVRIKREEKILAQKLQGYLQEFINQKTDNDQIKVYALSEAIQNLIKKENIKEIIMGISSYDTYVDYPEVKIAQLWQFTFATGFQI